MSNFKNKLLSISGEMSREEQLENLNEDHRYITKENSVEVNLRQAFQEVMSRVQSIEYELSGFNSLVYGAQSPEKIIEQARRTQEQQKKLKAIAYEKLDELKQVIDEVLCPDDEYKDEDKMPKKDFSYEKKMSIPHSKPDVEMEIGTTDFDDDFEEDEEWDDEPYYAKAEKKKGKKYAMKLSPKIDKGDHHEEENEYMKNPGKFYGKKYAKKQQEDGPFFGKKYSMSDEDKNYAKKTIKKKYSKKDC